MLFQTVRRGGTHISFYSFTLLRIFTAICLYLKLPCSPHFFFTGLYKYLSFKYPETLYIKQVQLIYFMYPCRLTLAALGLKLNDYWNVKKAKKLQDQVEDNKETEETP